MAWNAARFSRRDCLAWSLALLLHGLAAFALLRPLEGAYHARVADTAPRAAFTVRLLARPRPRPPPPQPTPQAAQPTAARPASPHHRSASRPQPAPAPDAPASPAAVVPGADAARIDAPASGSTEMGTAAPDTSRFDHAAASKTVRKFAAELNARPGAAAEWKPTRDEMLERAIEGSRKSDCRTAYAGAGLLAPLFLLHDAVSDKGCKW